MRIFWAIFILSIGSASSAAELKYKCFGTDDNGPYGIERLEVTVTSRSQLTIKMSALKEVTETYVLNPKYVSKTKNYRQFNVSEPQYDAYGEGPVTPFYVEPQLLTGGYRLRKGGMGAFIRTTGHGFSWARYLCVLQ